MTETAIYQYCGAIHIHTKFSDGTGDIISVSRAAKKAGLDWIIITDHNCIDAEEGFFNGVCVIKGQEISPHSENHYLVFGANEVIEPCDNPQIYIDKVRELGGFGFAAHPDEGVNVGKNGELIPRKNSNHCIPWTNKNVKPDGVEIWNWFSNWADNYNDTSLLTKAYSFFFKHKIVKNPSPLTLNWWDGLNNEVENIVPALGGVDAHALLIKDYFVPLYIFPYTTCFKTINNIIHLKEPLSEDFKEAKKQILSAVTKGNNIIINKRTSNDIPGFSVCNNKNIAYCGESINLEENTVLNIKTNKITDVKILLNGKEIFKTQGKICTIPINEKGKYRAEFSYNGRGFAYTNPIVVK